MILSGFMVFKVFVAVYVASILYFISHLHGNFCVVVLLPLATIRVLWYCVVKLCCQFLLLNDMFYS